MIRPERWISPELLFLCGVFSLPAFLFGEAVWAKVFLMLVYLALSMLAGRRVKVLPNLIVGGGIVAANLFTPFGKILFYLGHFPVTEGALKLGFVKAATIIGLIYLSRLTIRSTIRLPGRLGEIFSLMLYYFERITEQRIKIDRKNLWESLDRLLENVYATDNGESGSKNGPVRTKIPGYAFAAGFFILNWGVFLFERLA